MLALPRVASGTNKSTISNKKKRLGKPKRELGKFLLYNNSVRSGINKSDPKKN